MALTGVSSSTDEKQDRATLRICGVAATCSGLLGLLILWSELPDRYAPEWESVSEVAKSARDMLLVVSAVCNLALVCIGTMLLRLRGRWSFALTGICIVEALVLVGVGLAGAGSGDWVQDWALAMGVGIASLTPQFVVLFPLWGPIVSVRAHTRRCRRVSLPQDCTAQCPEATPS